MTKPQASIVLGVAFMAIIAFLSLASAVPAQASRTGGGSVNYFASNSDGLSTVYYNTGPVEVGSSATGIAAFFVQGYSNQNFPDLAIASSTGQFIFAVGGPDTLASTTRITQYQGFAAPTIATSTGAGVGVTAGTGTTTLAVNSTDLAGSIFLATGSNPAVNATIFTVTMGSTTPSNSIFCVLNPANSLTVQSAASTTYVGTTTNGFTLKSSALTGLVASSTYQWNYHCN